MDIISSFLGPFFSNMRRLAQKQHIKAKLASSLVYYDNNYSKSCLKRSHWHKLYVFTLCFAALRLALTSIQIQTGNTLLKVVFLKHDATITLMTTSIAYLRNAFTLFCVSLVIGIALTVDWILSNKYDCLFFRQSYDLLVVNMESLFLLNDRFKVTFYHLFYPWRLIGYFKNCKTIWKGQMVLRFASARLVHFDPTTCTPVIRGKAVFLTGLLETIVLSHINGTGEHK